MYVILLSGGSGKRLWPLSNKLRPKQYIQLLDDEVKKNEKCSMIQRIWKQLEEANLAKNSIICTPNVQTEVLRSQLGNVQIVTEPEGKDTFPAIALSCAYLKSKMNASEDETVCIIPVDPFTEASYFQLLKTLPNVLETSNAEVTLLGVKPKYPSSKFGYIVPKEKKSGYLLIEQFIEKPNEETAKKLIEKGAIWNCGVFCLKIKDVLKHCKKYNIASDYDTMFKEYEKMPKISFDYEVLEKAKQLSAVAFDGKWKDLGTWNSFLEEMSSNNLRKSCNGQILHKYKCYQ